MDVLPSPPALSYPNVGQQTPASLQAIKQLVRLLLAREDASLLERLAPLPRASSALLATLDELPSVNLLATIRRQRLMCLLHGDPYVEELLPALWPSIQRYGRSEAMGALALASLTREISSLIHQAQIPVLVIKGVPLALQTTHKITTRGKGDLDLFVDPTNVSRTVSVLQSAGFQTKKEFDSCFIDTSLFGCYCRWWYNEITLTRKKDNEVQIVDLHWSLDFLYKALPSFCQSYTKRSSVLIGETSVCTLNLTYTFQHACAHAAKDKWIRLRNLVDIHRLARSLDQDLLSALQGYYYVRSTCLVTHHLTGLPLQKSPFLRQSFLNEKIIRKARNWQLWDLRQPPPKLSYTFVSLLRFRSSLIDGGFDCSRVGVMGLLNILVRLILPPWVFFNSETGQFTLSVGYYIKKLRSILEA